MENAAVAQMFDDIADCLEIAGENPFRTRAYRRAAEAVANFDRPIEEAADANTLLQIEGLGEATADKVKEFLATGKVRFLERLRREYPASLLEMLRVPNLGPKKVKQLYQEKQIDSLEALVAALDKNELSGLSGFGPKTIENIRQGIARLAQVSTRLPLTSALDLVAGLRSGVATATGTKLHEAGSLRRGCDTVGNIDLVAQTEAQGDFIRSFVALPTVVEVLEQDAGSAQVKMRPGIEVRVRCTAPDNFGATLFGATGSAAHLEGAHRRAESLGLRIAPDGIFRGAERIGGAREEEIYHALGVPFIPPELREGRGEWESAEAGTLPSLLTVNDMKGDLHTHSTWSDGAATIRQMVAAARERGYAYIAVTDHSKALAMTNGLDARRLREQAKEIAEVQAEFPDIKILRGVECDILRDGTMDLEDDILHELDIVVASVHSAFKLDEATQTARIVRAISHPAVDIVGHPTGRIVGGRSGYEVNIGALIEAAKGTGTALEINASERLDLSDDNARAAREAGVMLTINSDAHTPRMFPNVALGVLIARRAWCQAGDVLNSKPVEDLLKWLKRPQSQSQ